VEQHKTKQCIENLSFYLYERALHPELFQIHRMQRVEQRRYRAEVWIVGQAHVVSVIFGRDCITEMVGPENDILPKGGLVSSFRFRGERDHTQTFNNGARYMLSSQVERMTANLFPSSYKDLVSHAHKGGLFVDYPESSSDALPPFSFLDFEAREREFHVHAYHAFPDDLTLVKTQSIFELPQTIRHS